MSLTGISPPRSGPFLAYRSLVAGIDRVSRIVVIAALAVMTAIVSVQVLLRYGFNYSIDSADELARLFFVWSMFLGIPHGIRYGVHVGIDILTALLPKLVQDGLFRIMCGVSAILMGIVTVATVYVAADTWDELMPTVNVTAAVFYIAVLAATVHAILHLLVLIWGGVHSWHDIDRAEATGKGEAGA